MVRFTLLPLTPRETAGGIHWIAGWVGPGGASHDAMEKSLAYAGNRTPAVQP
jgi:hypothetical protein